MRVVRGELMLLLAVILNSLGVVLLLYSGSGISAISSVPFSLNLIMPTLSLGTWTYIFQALVLVLFICRKKMVLSYLLSFVVGFFFGLFTDIHTAWVYALPVDFLLRVVYFALGYVIIAIGIAASNRCQMPLIPTDLFPRELSSITSLPYARVKISFDVTCLVVTIVLTLSFTGRVQGLGVGTVLAALTTGWAVDRVGAWMVRHWTFVSVFSKKELA